jgi:GntR family transcriptional regulator/MocR family aminotransferase
MLRIAKDGARVAEPLFEIRIEKPPKGSGNAAANLYRQLKDAIVDGRLPAGAKLPASRASRKIFGVSRNTVIAVYERLLLEGFAIARAGSGTYVADSPGNGPSKPRDTAKAFRYDHLNAFWLSPDVREAIGFWRMAGDGLKGPSRQNVDLRPALIDPRLFPHDVFRRAMVQQLRKVERAPPRGRSPQGDQGSFRLRAAVTRHIAITRAIACDPDEVIVTSGAQQAFDLLARILAGGSDVVVAVEDPGYPPLRIAFAAAGARLAAIPVDDEGLVVDALPADTNVICLCPSHQFPLGVSMSPERRAALIAFARKRGAVIVEDDYDGEFRHDGAPLAALKAEDREIVFHVGTFSKCMLPTLRLGFIVAPEWSRAALVAAKNCADWHSSALVQASVAAFISQGHLTRHVRKMRQIYRKRRDFIMTRLREQFAGKLAPVPSSYGMHVTAKLREDIDAEAVVEMMEGHNVRIHSLKRYAFERQAPSGLIFGCGVSDEAAIDHALKSLRKVLNS